MIHRFEGESNDFYRPNMWDVQIEIGSQYRAVLAEIDDPLERAARVRMMNGEQGWSLEQAENLLWILSGEIQRGDCLLSLIPQWQALVLVRHVDNPWFEGLLATADGEVQERVFRGYIRERFDNPDLVDLFGRYSSEREE